MKNVIGIIILTSFLFACKKDYKCQCNTLDPQKGFINDVEYTVEARKKSDALEACLKKFDNSGLATGGLNCEIR